MCEVACRFQDASKACIFTASIVIFSTSQALACNHLSPADYIQSALNYFVSDHQADVANRLTEDGPETWEVDKYASVADFLNVNPDCCEFSFRGSEGYLPGWFHRLWFDFHGYVRIEFVERVSRDGQHESRVRRVEIPMNSCGEVIHLLVE